MSSSLPRFIDIGANLTDPVFRGLYHGTRKHEDDLTRVLARAWDAGLRRVVVTGGSLNESREAVELAKTDERLACTVGCHPTRCSEFASGPRPSHSASPTSDSPYSDEASAADAYYEGLSKLAADNSDVVVAVGECGLDYDRLHFCDVETQKTYFERQFDLAESTQLPMFLHLRNAAQDFLPIMRRHRDRIKGGVVHSFTGSWAEASTLLDLDLFLGLNGCSLKTKDNLDVAARIPLDRLMLETDAPWCEIKASHAGFSLIKTTFPTAKKPAKWDPSMGVKGRNEPCNIQQVAEIVAGVRDESLEEIIEAAYQNSSKMFFSRGSS